MRADWPKLDWPQWRETALHLQLMTQIAGKIRLACSPWLNHGWHVALYVTPRGLTTSPIPYEGGSFALDFDLVSGTLQITHGDDTRVIQLGPGSMAEFHEAVFASLADLGIAVRIDRMPNEMPDPVRFDRDTASRPWDGEAVARFHRALVLVDGVFKRFRTGFLGKASPVHFFWGSFDLAVTRFSGRTAPRHPGGFPGLPDAVTREAYSHEEASAGFWPGSDAFPKPAFYAYAYPAPDGYAEAAVPAPACYDSALGEWLLDYDAVRAAPDPEAMLFGFLRRPMTPPPILAIGIAQASNASRVSHAARARYNALWPNSLTPLATRIAPSSKGSPSSSSPPPRRTRGSI